MFWHNHALYIRRGSKIARFTAILCILFFLGIIVYGIRFTVKGWRPGSCYLSPHTLDWIKAHIPNGTTIAGSRYGSQILAYTLSYRYKQIPFDDPFNAYYTRAYGIKPWTREEALQVFINWDVRYIAFFLGEVRSDPYLEIGAYGDYITSMLSQPFPEIDRIIYLPDGIVIKLAKKEKLLGVLRAIKSSG